jgi:large subunit ribosomal protein L22
MPRARGSGAPIKKRMTHITVIIGAKPEEEAKAEKAAKPAKKKAAKKSAE